MLTYAIGDVHGCLARLTRLLERCADHAAGQPYRLVFVGDYIDRGPDSRGVLTLLIELQRKSREVVCLRGNHEALLIEAVGTGDALLWLMNGAAETRMSYDIEDPADLPPDHVDWVAALPASFDDGLRYFVHAGVNPTRPLDQQVERDQVWIREPFLSSARDYGRLIVHGHTPLVEGVPDVRPNRVNIDTAAVYGGRLTAAVFTDEVRDPVAFLTDGRD
jgi:diadenosine tetraphosphatase ApaH/serine/threonine PP2A family protein phosphatase